MSIDRRLRTEADIRPFDADDFFGTELPALASARQQLVGPWLRANALAPFTLCCEQANWQLHNDAGELRAAPGQAEAGTQVRLSAEDLSLLLNDLVTPITFLTMGPGHLERGSWRHYLDWWLVLRALLDAQPLHLPGDITLCDAAGGPLDLAQAFSLDSDVQQLRHFLDTAGFLHLRGVFSPDEMAVISADIDAAQAHYREGDGRSWWASTADGERRVVRMQGFDQVSAATAALLQDQRFLQLAAIAGEGHVHNSLEDNAVEALVKPLQVVDGISDLPWHKDCAQGRHSFDCCSLTVGISVTGADEESGQIRAIAGSHRALISPSHIADPHSFGLPVVDLPTQTGDITIHLSCTHHMAQAPKTRERKVLYSSFRYPEVDMRSANPLMARINTAREAAQHMSDKPRH